MLKAPNLHRLFTIIFHWSQVTFMFLMVDWVFLRRANNAILVYLCLVYINF